jgi:phage-related protein
LNGFQKKTQKTPKKEIELAEKLKFQYFKELKTNKK